MKVLSIRQPWAFLIIHGAPILQAVDAGNGDGSTKVEYSGENVVKNIENRTWPLPANFDLPQRIGIHAATKFDPDALDWLMRSNLIAPAIALMLHSQDKKNIPRGALIGTVVVQACITASYNPWFTGPYGFVLTDPQAFEPRPMKGHQGFFKLPLAMADFSFTNPESEVPNDG